MKLSNVLLSSVVVLNTFGTVSIQAADSKIGEANINMALNKNGVASSIQDSGTPESEAFDGIIGQNDNRWATSAGKDASAIDQSWIYVDLGASKEVNKFVLNWESRPNKFKMQVSDDLNNWQDVTETIDNGFFKDSEATFPENKAINTIELNAPVKARYVKMQGIQRRREKNNDNNTGYSLYEFEVYGPGWSNETYVDEYLSKLTVNNRVNKDFTLPISDDEYGVTISWKSNDKAVSIDKEGKAKITRSDSDQKVTLIATVVRENISKEREFKIVVANKAGKEYEIYPVPQNILYDEGELEVSDEINLVFEDSVSDIIKGNYTDVLEKLDIKYLVGNNVDTSKTNLLVGIKDGEGIVDEYYQGVDYNAEISTDKNEGYVLDVNSDENIIAILGNNDAGTKYGSYSLDDLIEQGEGVIQDLTIEDAPDVEYRGFIEGFYGSWSHENRKSLIEFGGQYKMNTYIYGPKNDPYHYGQWRDMYPEDKLNELKELVDAGKKSGVEFVWAAHVGGHTDLSDGDIAALEKKFDQLYDIGVRQFAIFFDDSSTNNTRLVEYMNKIQQEYVDQKGDVKPLIFCPQYYRKDGANESYLRNISNFDQRIQVMWTGDHVVSEINQASIDWITNLIQRPVYIWWNWPVNDLGRSHLMHLGPSEGLENGLHNMSGMTSNPMNQAQASKVSLYSIADYTWNSTAYDSDASWKSALKHIITDDEEASKAFQIFAQNCAAAPMSFGETDESVYMQKDLNSLKTKFINGENYQDEAIVVKNHLLELQDAIKTLKAYKGTNNLSGEINQWMDVVNDIAEAGIYVVDSLTVYDQVDQQDNSSITNAMEIITNGKQKLDKSNQGHGGKKAAQKVLYPFVENLLNEMEEGLYQKLDIQAAYKGFGTAKKDYSLAIDGQKSSNVELGQYINGDYFGVNLGKEMNISDIEIIMQEKKDNKPAYYKEGSLEYSLDNQNWIKIGDFDSPVVQAKMDVKARYIRYRATSEHEDSVTGANNSKVILNEILINQDKIAVSSTNDPNLTLQTVKDENVVTISSKDQIILSPHTYIRTTFDQLKNLTSINLDNNEVTLKVSDNGLTWVNQPINELKNMTAKYIEISNLTDHDLKINNIEIRLAGKLALKAALTTNSGDIYSGNANNLVDGNEDTTLWLKRGDNGNDELTRYIDLDLQGITSLSDMEVIFSGDNVLYGRVDASLDGETWKTIYNFDSVGTEHQKIQFNGEQARYLRYYMSNGNWIQIKEMYVNRLLDENVTHLEGDVSNLKYLDDGNIFTSVKTGDKVGKINFKTFNNPNPKQFVLLKDKDSTVVIKAKVQTYEKGLNEKWIELGEYQDVRNIIDLSNYNVSELELSWTSNIEIFEAYFQGQQEIQKLLLSPLIEKAQLLERNGALDNVHETIAIYFHTALANAINIDLSQDVSQLQVDQAYEQLAYAIQLLDFKADKTLLKALIDECEAVDLSKYEMTGQEEFKAALKNAQDVYNDPNALDEVSINKAVDELTKAKGNLVLKQIDTSQLEYMIKLAQKALENIDKYKQDEAWNIFVTRLNEAKEILVALESQEAVNTATQALSDAYGNLRIKPDESIIDDLKKFLEETKNLDYSKYSLATQNKIKAGIEAVEKILSNENSTQKELLEASTLVKEARELIKHPDVKHEEVKENQKQTALATGDDINLINCSLLAGLAGMFILLTKKKEN